MEVELRPAPGTAYLRGDQLRVLDLSRAAAELRAVPGRTRETLAMTSEVRLVAMLLAPGERLEEREASRPVAVQVVDGEVRVEAADQVAYARAGELLVLPSAATLSVEAVRDSSLLLTLVSERLGPEGLRGAPEGSVAVEWQPPLQELTAADVMNPVVVAVTPGTSLTALVERLVEYRISAVPVVNEAGEVIGIVSETDLIDEEKRRIRLPRTLLFGVYPILEEAVREAYDESRSLTARDLMTQPVFVVPAELPARQVAEELVTRQINHVPVTRDGQLVGIIARADLLRAVQAEWRRPGAGVTAG